MFKSIHEGGGGYFAGLVGTLRTAAVTLGAASVMIASGAHAQEKVTLRLDWKIYGSHAPFLLAKERGYYAKEGLNVTVLEGAGVGPAVKVVAAGAEEFGFIDYGSMVRGIEQGIPLKAIFGVFQRSPMIIVSREDNPIRTPKDLAGKIIAMAPEESTAQIFPAMLGAAKVDPKLINVVNPAVGAKLTLFLQKRADAMTSFINVQVAQVEAQGVKPVYFSYADHGAGTLSIGLVTNETMTAQRPETVRKFLRAVSQAWKDAIKDPDAAIAAALKTFPEYASQKAVLRRQLDLTFPLLETPNTKGQPLGWMSEKDWNDTQRILRDFTKLDAKKAPSSYFTNDFVPK